MSVNCNIRFIHGGAFRCARGEKELRNECSTLLSTWTAADQLLWTRRILPTDHLRAANLPRHRLTTVGEWQAMHSTPLVSVFPCQHAPAPLHGTDPPPPLTYHHQPGMPYHTPHKLLPPAANWTKWSNALLNCKTHSAKCRPACNSEAWYEFSTSHVSVRVSFTGGGCTSSSSTREPMLSRRWRWRLGARWIFAAPLDLCGRCGDDSCEDAGGEEVGRSSCSFDLCELWTWMSVESGMKGKEKNVHLLTSRTSCCHSRFFLLICSLVL